MKVAVRPLMKRAVELLQAVRVHIPLAVVRQRRIIVLWILTMMDITPSMKMMIMIGIATGVMMIMLPEWMMRWRMRSGKS